jgi:hypothetical protein
VRKTFSPLAITLQLMIVVTVISAHLRMVSVGNGEQHMRQVLG